ncbi:MAG: right-handed parallel beta-helix repeat-containing protein [Planctomycetes bacterium]|nr:right-handed parallel beta-helix repeat-containing protein [Planctomycetota bacterium]
MFSILVVVCTLVALGAWSAATPPCPQVPVGVRFVNPSATGLNDGTSWPNAYTSLDVALAAVQPGEQVWVRQAKYFPTNLATGFRIPANVGVYGAFLGTESDLHARQGSAKATILEGVIGGQVAQHVVSIVSPQGSGVPGVVLDGFTIQHGNAYQAPSDGGGGILCQNTNLILAGCTISENNAEHGGGLSFEGLGADGIDNALWIKQCLFEGNTAVNRGGGMFAEGLTGAVVSTQFRANEATENGGGVFLWKMGISDSDRVPFTNCVFWGNWVYDGTPFHYGGAVYLAQASSTDPDVSNASFTNCTFSDNYADNCTDGQALYVSGNSRAQVYNSILAFNYGTCTGNKPLYGPPGIVVEYTDTWWGPLSTPWTPGSGNTAVDPVFRGHLSGLVALVGKAQGQPGSSPCIDAADHGRLPVDVLDVDDDGDITEILPLDVDTRDRFSPRWETDTGAPPTESYLDMGAYELPWWQY